MSSNAGFSIKFGKGSTPNEKDTSQISIKAHTLKHEIELLQNSLKSKFQTEKIPFIVVQVPKHIPESKVPVLSRYLAKKQDTNIIITKVEKDDCNCYLVDAKDPNDETLTFIKKLDKAFSQLNTVNKECFIEGQFYQLKQRIHQLKTESKPLAPWLVLFNNCLICGKLELSSDFWKLFTELVTKISPKFAHSPIMALAPLTQTATIDLEFESVDELDQSIKDIFIGQVYQELYEVTMDKKEKKENNRISVFICFRQLGYVEIGVDAELVAVFGGLDDL